jgi:hypothetical protein
MSSPEEVLSYWSAPVLRPYVIGVTFEGPVGLVRETTTVEVGEGRNVELEVQLDT